MNTKGPKIANKRLKRGENGDKNWVKKAMKICNKRASDKMKNGNKTTRSRQIWSGTKKKDNIGIKKEP